MVQLKYYGDDRDYFKYDLITFLLKESVAKDYGFIPMLTAPRKDGEGEIKPTQSECKSKDLFEFIRKHSSPDLNNWERWLASHVRSYRTVQPVNKTFIGNDNRQKYWLKFEEVFGAPDSLVFLDPDTGLQAGRKTKIYLKEFEKYILDEEIVKLSGSLSESSIAMVYQHLQRDSTKHDKDIRAKRQSLLDLVEDIQVLVYREKDLAFIFLIKRQDKYEMVFNAIRKYADKSTVEPNGIYPSENSSQS